MSTLQAANISDGTDTLATGYVVNGSAKGWGHFDQSPSTVLNNSLNVSSLTDIGTGQASLNLTSSLVSDEYPVSAAASVMSGSAINYANGGWLSGSSVVSFDREKSSGSAHDGVNLSLSCIGDLA